MRQLYIILIVIFAFSIFSCGGSSGGGGSSTTKLPAKLDIASSVAVFAAPSGITVANTSVIDKIYNAIFRPAYAADEIQIVYDIDVNDAIKKTAVTDEEGNEITPWVTGIKKLNSKMLLLEFAIRGYGYYTVACDLEAENRGALYEVGSYEDAMACRFRDVIYVDGLGDYEVIAYVFDKTTNLGELRRINVKTGDFVKISGELQISLNGVSFTGYYGSDMVLFAEQSVMAYSSGKIVCKASGQTNLDKTVLNIDGTGAGIVTLPSSYTESDYAHYSVIITNTGNIIKASIDDGAQTDENASGADPLLRIQHCYLPTEWDRWIISRTKFGKIQSDGSILYSAGTPNAELFNLTGKLKMINNKIYGLSDSNTNISSAEISSTTGKTDIYNGSVTIDAMWFVGDYIVFNSNGKTWGISSTEVNGTPNELSSEPMTVGSIVKL